MINEHDFICLSETKTDEFDTIQIPGYLFEVKNRKSKSTVRSGGIAFGYREEFHKYIQIIETSSKVMMWVKISSELCKTDQDVLIGITYIPPENSVYKTTNVYDEIEGEILRFSSTHKYILLSGDFNSRTGIDEDFSTILSNSHDHSDIVDVNYADCLYKFNMSRTRCSNDARKNTYGNALLDLCRSHDLFILNGRVEGDKCGMFTCKNASVVDYNICSYELLQYVEQMKVLEFSSLYSDVHNPLSLHMSFNATRFIDNDGENDANNEGLKRIKKMGL